MEKARIYSEFETFYAMFKPLTPYGRAEKEKRFFFTDKSALEKEYSLIDSIIPLVSVKTSRDKLRFHLRNIPLLKVDFPIEDSAVELFLARKFLSNAKAIFEIIPDKTRELSGASFSSEKLLELLDKGGNGEAFYIADCYSKELAAKRKELLLVDLKLKGIKQECLKNIIEKYGLDFSDRDFLVMLEKNYSLLGEQHDLYAEHYDFGRLIVKPVYSKEYLSVCAQRGHLRSQEAALEKKVIVKLVSEVNAEREKLRYYRDCIASIDIAAEKARLAADSGMCRPEISEISSNGNGEYLTIAVQKAHFMPLEAALQKKDMEYTPFSAVFDRKINILHGSNMGGKTVVLKTFVFMQMLAQSGFYVPAEKYSTVIFKEICFIGGEGSTAAGGLSSFGVEINDFVQACLELEKGPALFIMDEFARTTNSEEGTALLSAILSWLAVRRGAFVFLATHLSGIDSPENTSWFRMKGFDRMAFGNYFAGNTKAGLEEKLKSINQFMCYEMLSGSRETESRDAIKIAGILGVNQDVIKEAEKIITADPADKK